MTDQRRYFTEVMFLDIREDPTWSHLTDDEVREVVAKHLDEMGIDPRTPPAPAEPEREPCNVDHACCCECDGCPNAE